MPMTEEQRRSRKSEFIQSIDKDAICALASRHNGGLPCHLDESTPPTNGSYNVCFFIEFFTPERTQWVVRIPIETVLHSPWEKLQSEVCTIQYLRAHTTIPIPKVHAHGRARLRQDEAADEICYMIMERAAGRPLDGPKFLEASEDQRQRFFKDLIVVLAQLRGLTFTAAGSLMPSPPSAIPLPRWLQALFSPGPIIASAMTISLNDLQMDMGGTWSMQSPPTSMDEFAAWVRCWLWDLYLVPPQDLGESTAQRQVFSLHMVLQHLLPPSKEQSNSQSNGQSNGQEQFILMHSDLRGPNIMVDDEFRIQAILDWEWATTVPATFFTPPFCFTQNDKSRASFYSALASFPPSTCEPSISLLQKEWTCLDGAQDNLAQHMGNILEYPNDLSNIFYKSIYPRLSDIPSERAQHEFFCIPKWQEEVRSRVQNSERYREYLKANDLYKVDEEALRRKAILAQAKAYLASLKKKST